MSETIEFTHTIDAKLASNIGEESISNPIQAIAEIKKNSYDADAHNSWITFEGNPIDPLDVGSVRKISKIIIRDDGFGMTLEDLQNKFFRIGTDNKQRNTISPENKRRVVGEKGMGHVAIKRLGNVCKIISNPRPFRCATCDGKGIIYDKTIDDDKKCPDCDGRGHTTSREPSTSMNKTIVATINWNDFEYGLNFSEIKSKGEILDRDVNQTTGLQIEITELNETEYSVEKFREIEKTLGMLLVPEHLRVNKNDEFRIHIEGPGDDLRMHPIAQAMGPLDNALLRLTGIAKYDEQKNKTKISYFIDKRTPSKNSPGGHIWDRVQIGDNRTITEDQEGKLFGDAKLVLYHYPQGGFGKFKDEQKTLLVRKEIQAFTGKYSGIKIFADNVRLYPFGERAHPTMYDWAEIDSTSMRAQMGGRIRLDTVVGFLTITRETSIGIKEVATRQGVMDTPQFLSLKEDFVRKLYKALQDFKAKNTAKVTKTKTFREEKALSRLDLAKRDLQALVPDAVRRSQIEEHLKEVQHEVSEASKDRKQFEKDVVSEQEMYRALSSLGISTLAFEHEIGPNYSIVNTIMKNVLRVKSLPDQVRDDVKFSIGVLTEIQQWREYLDVFTAALGEMEDTHHKKMKINVREMIDELLQKVTAVSPYVDEDVAESKISYVVNTIGVNKTIFANRATLLAVFSNLVLNSIKSLKFVGREKPKIKVTINSNSKTKTLDLLFEDNGNGIPENNIDKIWTAFRSFYPKHGKNKEYRGMGLGLTLCQNIIEESYNGEITLDKTISDKDNPGKGMARFKISIPLQELKE